MKNDRTTKKFFMIITKISYKNFFILILLTFCLSSCKKTLTFEESEKFRKAIYNNDTEYINFILSKRINLNDENAYGYLPLYVATSSNNIKIIDQFIKHGANINQKNSVTKDTCLLDVESLEIAQFLIDKGAEINYQDYIGATPLHHFTGVNLDIMKLLIQHGADVNKIDDDGKAPISRAVMFDHYESFKLLVNSGAELNVIDKHGANLFNIFALRGCDIRIAETLFRNDVSVFHKNNISNNCLMIASRGLRRKTEDKTKYIKYFISKGIDINMQSVSGYTALHYAVENNQYEICKLLLELGAIKNIMNINNQTPYQIALENGNEEIIKLLAD